MPATRWWDHALWLWRVILGDPIPGHETGLFFERLASLLATGAPVPQALRDAARASNPELQRICNRAAVPVAVGMPLYQALAPWRHRLPEIIIPVLEVGQVSGTLEGSARRLAEAFGKGAAVERPYRFSVFDWRLVIPALALFRTVTMVGGVGLVNPAAALAVFLAAVATSLVKLTIVYLVGRLAFRWLFKVPALRMAADTLKLAVPQTGAVARNFAAARWARSFATLWDAGVPVSQALEVSSRSALNAHYEGELLRAARATRAGSTLRASLAGVGLLPRHFVEILATGETTGNFGRILERFATLLECEALNRGKQQMNCIVVAANVVWIVISLLLVGAVDAL